MVRCPSSELARSDAMMVAVGFNPRFASPHLAVRRVATGRKSAPYIPFLKFDLVQLEQFAVFLLERFRTIMLALPLNVSNFKRQGRLVHRRCAVCVRHGFGSSLRDERELGFMDRGLNPTPTIVSSLRNGRN